MFNTTREYPSSPTMDNLETASNISVSSNLSSLSGLTGYEEELYDLKNFIKVPASSPRPLKFNENNHHGQFGVFEERIKILSLELENALKLNEKYKNEMSNMERKTELSFHEKFEKLLRHNAKLEAQLSVANDRIHNFLFKPVSNSNEEKLMQLERQDFEFKSKINLLENEVTHWKKEAEGNEVLNSRFKLEIEEMKIEVSTKSNSIDALKSKIVELHLEMQNLNQDSVKIHNLLAITTNELDSFKKSEKWYKEQLHLCRGQKSEALEEFSKLQSTLITKDLELDLKNSDLTNLKNNFEEFNLIQLQEKEKLLKKIDELQIGASKINSPVEIFLVDPNLTENYESTIESLTRELISIKEAVNEQQASFETRNKQNSDLIAQNTTLKKLLTDKEFLISNLETEKIDLNVRLEIILERLKENERILMKTVNEKAEFEVNLLAANREKREIEDAVKIIRENFSKFAGSYNKIKEELNEKNKIIFRLQNENFKFTEGKVLELEETNRKLNLDLQEVNFKLQSEKENSQILKATKENEQKLTEELSSYHNLTKNLKKDFQVLKENFFTATKDLELKDKLIIKLEQDLNISNGNLEAFRKTHSEKINSFQRKLEEPHDLNILLQKENLELKDKLSKFLTNNFNGFRDHNKTDSVKEEEFRVDSWFSGVLNWIIFGLNEIHANQSLTQAKFIYSQCPKKNLQEKFEEISRLLLRISSRRFGCNKNVLEPLRCLEDVDKRQEDFEALQKIKRSNVDADKEINLETNVKILQEELKQLKILYKAKELENNEKRKRYEVNNRTLLKKVKEHMRGRNSTEKRCSYLQELYNNVFDELNSYKLQENAKDGQIQNLQNVCENYKNINTKMKQELVRLEKDITIAEATKVQCLENQSLKETLMEMELKTKVYEEQLKEKEILLNDIQIQLQHTTHNNVMLQKENKNLLVTMEKLNEEFSEQTRDLKKLEITLEKERKNMEEVQKKLLDEQRKHSDCVMQLGNAQQIFQHTQEKNKLFLEEIEILNSKLNNSKNEFNSLEAKNNSLIEGWSRKEDLMETFVRNLQSEIQLLQTDLASVRSDKNFLQRLCTDLKLALETSLNQNKVLKKHIETLSSESKEYSSLADSINLPSPSKYDDAYINKLLKQSNAPQIEKPLGDLQNCLNSLKKEMICLRKQVTDRTSSRV